MELWLSCALFLLSAVGIVLLSLLMRNKKKKAGYIVGIVLMSILAAAAAGYSALTLLFISLIA